MHSELKSWSSVWHPRYRVLLIRLFLLGSVCGSIVYFENALLQGLIQSLGTFTGTDGSSVGSLARWFYRTWGNQIAPLAILVAIFIVGISRALLSAKREILSGNLFIRSRNDLEQQILLHLLHRDDDFYSTHSLGEVMNRLEVDLLRVLGRRQTVIDIWWSCLVIIGNIVFFAIAQWRLAFVVAFICILGVVYTQYVSRPLTKADKNYFEHNDRVKMDFEDYLKATPEIQVGAIYDAISERFAGPQSNRLHAFMKWIRAHVRVGFVRNAWPAAAFLVTVFLILWVSRFQNDSQQLSLVPVLIFALPGIFGHATYLVSLKITYGLASNSIERIVEYDSGQMVQSPKETAKPGALSIRVNEASYHHVSKDGSLQGGVAEISTRFSSGRFSAIVGEAGSGKSTFINMLLGRQKPQSGWIEFIDKNQMVFKGELSSIATLMPQKNVLFDTSIRENLEMGRPDPDPSRSLSRAEVEIIHKTGLASVCHLKALEMRPADIREQLTDENAKRLMEMVRQKIIDANVAGDDVFSIRPGLTWRENLLGRPGASGDQSLDGLLVELIGQSPCYRYFLDQGLEFRVGRNGSRLSGGQGQLVCLVRALFRDTLLLVLDEPTSALDPAGRDRVAGFLDEWCKKRIIISISHDPEFIRHAHEIQFFSSGRLIATGNFDELRVSSRQFRKVFRIE